MKNILKYGFILLGTAALAAACQGFEDFENDVTAPSKLAYAKVGTDNVFNVKVSHRGGVSTGEFSAQFPIHINTNSHSEFKGTFAYDAALVESYNKAHGTDYQPLPESNLELENTTLTVPANASQSQDSVKIALTGDLSTLTARRYLAPLKLTSPSYSSSEELGTVYIAVETEVNLIRAISAAAEIDGLQPARSSWVADCADAANLFDGSTSTSATPSGVVTVDMRKTYSVAGLAFTYSGNTAPAISSIEYSTDGKEYKQAGTPATSETARASSVMSVAFTELLEAQYIRFTTTSRIYEFSIYADEGGAAVYASANNENTFSGVVTHRTGATSTGTLSASFNANVSKASTSGYSVSVALDASAVAAYNSAHGTSYAALPAANLSITGAPLAIAAGAKSSTAQASVTLTGNLNSLTNQAGYLAPLKLSASGATTSAERGYVYVVVTLGKNNIKTISAVGDIDGAPAPRVEWTCTGISSNWANAIDGSTTTYTGSVNSNTVITVDMKQVQKFSGMSLAYRSGTNYGTPSAIKIETSTDGSNFTLQGTASASGDYVVASNAWYVGLDEPVDAQYVRFTPTFSRAAQISELNFYATDAEPMVFVKAGTNNLVTGGTVDVTPVGILNGLNASFNIQVSSASASGYSVVAMVDNSYVKTYNEAHETNYGTVPESNIQLTNAGQSIAANATQTSQQVRVSLKGDLSDLSNAEGYIIPVKVIGGGLTTSPTYGVVYIEVKPVAAYFRKGFTSAQIEGTPCANRSEWEILWSDEEGIYPTHDGCSYYELFDGDTASTNSFVRTWGGPISFSVDLKKEYEITGLYITARTDNNTYRTYQPNDILVEYSDNGEDFETLGDPTYASGELVREVPTTYASLYAPLKTRYLRITASYGSNMGTSEFNIYVK